RARTPTSRAGCASSTPTIAPPSSAPPASSSACSRRRGAVDGRAAPLGQLPLCSQLPAVLRRAGHLGLGQLDAARGPDVAHRQPHLQPPCGRSHLPPPV